MEKERFRFEELVETVREDVFEKYNHIYSDLSLGENMERLLSLNFWFDEGGNIVSRTRDYIYK